MFSQSFITQFLHNNRRSRYHYDDRSKFHEQYDNCEKIVNINIKILTPCEGDHTANFNDGSCAKTSDEIDHKFSVPEFWYDFTWRTDVSEIGLIIICGK
jgi:hypothetical protein